MRKSFIAISQLLGLFSIALESYNIRKGLHYSFFNSRSVGFFNDGIANLKKKSNFKLIEQPFDFLKLLLDFLLLVDLSV